MPHIIAQALLWIGTAVVAVYDHFFHAARYLPSPRKARQPLVNIPIISAFFSVSQRLRVKKELDSLTSNSGT